MGWGGARPNSGPKKRRQPQPARAITLVPETAEVKPDAKPPRRIKITEDMVARARSRRPQGSGEIATFVPAQPTPGTIPRGTKLAMDSSGSLLSGALTWAQNSFVTAGYFEGQTFLGFPILSEMAQRAEYRRPVEIIATHLTRRWIEFQASGGVDAKDKTDKIKELEQAFDRFKVRDRFREIAEQDGFFGRAHLYIDTGVTDDRDELKMPLTSPDGSAEGKFGKDSLKAIRAVEPTWVWPNIYNSFDPLKPDWYNPSTWFVQGKEVHATRLARFVGREVPDFLKPAYAFGGLPMTQMGKPYVDNWLRTRQSVSNLVSNFSMVALKTDLGSSFAPGSDLFARVDFFNAFRDNSSTMVLQNGPEGEAEDLVNIAVPLGTLDMLQAQSQEHMSSVWGIPLVELFGISPHGLNASSDGEIRTFEDMCHAYQERLFRLHLTYVMKLIMVNEWGAIDPDITFKFVPLHTMTDKELAEIRKIEAETDDLLVNGVNAISPEEVRARITADPEMPYHSLNADEMPEPPQPPPGEGGEGGGAISLKGNQSYAPGQEDAQGVDESAPRGESPGPRRLE